MTAESSFETAADAMLRRLADRLEAALGDAEVDLAGGVLTVELDDGRQLVLNKHAVSRQLWLSSPVSGAHHFALVDGGWRSTRGDRTLQAVLGEDLGITVE